MGLIIQDPTERKEFALENGLNLVVLPMAGAVKTAIQIYTGIFEKVPINKYDTHWSNDSLSCLWNKNKSLLNCDILLSNIYLGMSLAEFEIIFYTHFIYKVSKPDNFL